MCAHGPFPAQTATTQAHLVVERCAQGQPAEDLREHGHDGGVVLVLDLPFKPIDLVHVLGLVVAARQVHRLRAGHLGIV